MIIVVTMYFYTTLHDNVSKFWIFFLKLGKFWILLTKMWYFFYYISTDVSALSARCLFIPHCIYLGYGLFFSILASVRVHLNINAIV